MFTGVCSSSWRSRLPAGAQDSHPAPARSLEALPLTGSDGRVPEHPQPAVLDDGTNTNEG